MIAEPPFAPAVNANDTEPSPGVATKDVGADGTVVGTLYDDDDADAALVRNPVYAFTANV